MGPNQMIGRNVQYWGKTGDKPNAALVVDASDNISTEETGRVVWGPRQLTLVVFTAGGEGGGRFIAKDVPHGSDGARPCWTEVGQAFP